MIDWPPIQRLSLPLPEVSGIDASNLGISGIKNDTYLHLSSKVYGQWVNAEICIAKLVMN